MICLSSLSIRTRFFQKSREPKARAFFEFTKPLLAEMSRKFGLNLFFCLSLHLKQRAMLFHSFVS